ncbi:TPA: uroporphyrinogen-III C-methyltransferase [Streptococcus suis]|nr:uroporphyrinogen-III C-methyltransferase [Streptococcus suis]HEM4052354.1 uroporphyrinogen-III C-methyltransferase [Streptococcus suis]HEM6393174.1 uroporphyrinogen-III C-methyltransferase [Streptococcus suis]HEM6435930.1 uroporphyrinogen-III C-methyltransferase [Streptococcus suis]
MTGFVSLLGAGPGDVELITVKGARRLREADVLVYDRLVNKDLFSYLSDKCQLIDVGKKPGMPCIRQEEIERILIEKARENKRVVRLKSGDPYIFGRGGEEAQALVEAGIPFEIVPGVTSAIAGATYAGIPMTFRDKATSFHVFTGHLQDEMESLNWAAISQLKGTLVFLMGMKHLSVITQELVNNGFSKDTPVAIVEWATHPSQRSIDGTLATIEEQAMKEEMKAPSIIVVGDVVSFRKELNFYEHLPLYGKRIFLQDSATGKLPAYLKDDGATLVKFPSSTQVNKLSFELPDLSHVDGMVFADRQSWILFLSRLREDGIDLRSLSHIQFAAIGHHTAKTLEEAGILLVAKGAQSKDPAILDLLTNAEGTWCGVAPEHKVEELQTLYDFPVLVTHSLGFDKEVSPEDWTDLDCVCLPNSVAAANFVALVEETGLDIQELPIIVMGETTRDKLVEAGYSRIIETDQPTILAIRDKCRDILIKENL